MSSRFVAAMIVVLATPLAAAPQHAFHPSDSTAGLVEHVRQITEPFGDVARAMNAGYIQFLGCVSGPQEGAMGVHFVNSALVGDGEIDGDRPEALVYEPQRNGELRLVAVEYIVVADAWHKHHVEPPVLEGQAFQYNSTPNRYGLPGFYELHVWAGRDNPNGAFVDWNPRVSCEGQ